MVSWSVLRAGHAFAFIQKTPPRCPLRMLCLLKALALSDLPQQLDSTPEKGQETLNEGCTFTAWQAWSSTLKLSSVRDRNITCALEFMD